MLFYYYNPNMKPIINYVNMDIVPGAAKKMLQMKRTSKAAGQLSLLPQIGFMWASVLTDIMVQ